MLAMKYAIGKNCFHLLHTRVSERWAVSERLLPGLSWGRANEPKPKLAMKD